MMWKTSRKFSLSECLRLGVYVWSRSLFMISLNCFSLTIYFTANQCNRFSAVWKSSEDALH